MYKFQKIKNSQGHPQFSHQFFRRDAQEDLIKIKRKTANNGRITKHSGKKRNLANEGGAKVQDRLSKLEKAVKLLTMQNQMLIKSNQRMLNNLIENKSSTDQKIKKLLLITHSVAKSVKTKTTGFNPLIARLETGIKDLQKSVNEEHKELAKECSDIDSFNINPSDQLLNEVLDIMYNESNKSNNIDRIAIIKAKKEAEDKLLEQLVYTETPNQTPNIGLIIDNNDFYNQNFLNSERIHNNLFVYDDPRKRDTSFNYEDFDFKNSKFSPHLLKPYSYDMNNVGKDVLK